MKTSVADDRDVSSKSVKANNAAKAKQSLAQVFRQDPARLVEWVKENIRLNPDKKALQIAQTPMGVWTSRLTDERSRKIFFVDVARSLGIEARVDAVTKKLQYKQAGVKEGLQNDVWIDVDFDAKASSAASDMEKTKVQSSPKGLLKLDYQPNGVVDDPKYYSHFLLLASILTALLRCWNILKRDVPGVIHSRMEWNWMRGIMLL